MSDLQARIEAAREKGREGVRSAIRRETHELTAEEAADLDLGKTTLHQVKVKHRKEAYAALDRLIRFERAEAVWANRDEYHAEYKEALIAAIEEIERA